MSRAPRPPDAELAARLGHEFRDPKLLVEALTHPSAAFERSGTRGNERLEFLGDAVLDLVIAHLLFEVRADWREGQLTLARAALVNTRSLASRAADLGLPEYVVLGRTEVKSGGESKDRILANLFEAVVGALYLDAGLGAVFALVRRVFAAALADPDRSLRRDPKTRFQEWAHAALRETPSYRDLSDGGEEAGADRFVVAVELAGEGWGVGSGRTKREAERAAAKQALERAETADG